ncbi:MAG: hypothetical protein WAQ22_00575 [Candidatus Saccharimonas sp.]
MENTPTSVEYEQDEEKRVTRADLIRECAQNIVEHQDLAEKIVAVNQCSVDRDKETYPYSFGTFISPDGRVINLCNDGDNRESPTGWTVIFCGCTERKEDFLAPGVEKLGVYDMTEQQCGYTEEKIQELSQEGPLLIATNTLHCTNGVAYNLFVTRDAKKDGDSYTICDHMGTPFLPLREIAPIIRKDYRSSSDIDREFQAIIQQSYAGHIEQEAAA